MNSYIYLVSTAHSGSTLLAFLLGNHPEIATVGELAGRTDYDSYRCSCGVLITQCEFWLKVKDRMNKKGVDLDLKNFDIFIDQRRPFSSFDKFHDYYFPFYCLDKIRDLFFLNQNRKKWIKDTIDRNILLAEAIVEVTRKKFFIDTTKDLYRLKHLVRTLKDKVKVLYVTRDGRGVVNSLIRKEKYSEEKAIRNWLWSNKTIRKISAHYCTDGQFYQVKYEDLCRNPESEIRSILEFIGASSKQEIRTESNDHFHIIGNVMRKKFSGRVALDEKWKIELSDSQRSLFERDASKMNRNLGYQ